MFKIIKKTLPLLSLALVVGASTAVARSYSEEGCCDKERMCAKNPLFCDGFNLSFHAGPSPIVWSSRGCLSFLNTPTVVNNSYLVSPCVPSTCSASPACNASNACSTNQSCTVSSASNNCGASGCSFNASNVVAGLSIPKFSRLFGTPWTIGTTLGYAVTQNHEVIIEANYTQASNKREGFHTTVVVGGVPVLLYPKLVSKYKNVSGYVGYRYNFDRGCKNISWFLAGKLGLVHHFNIRGYVDSSLSSSIADGDTTPFFPLFRSNTGFSGAAEVGMDVCLSCDWSLIVGAEVAATWGPKCKTYGHAVPDLGTNNIAGGKVGAEILFPITVGLRYKF